MVFARLSLNDAGGVVGMFMLLLTPLWLLVGWMLFSKVCPGGAMKINARVSFLVGAFCLKVKNLMGLTLALKEKQRRRSEYEAEQKTLEKDAKEEEKERMLESSMRVDEEQKIVLTKLMKEASEMERMSCSNDKHKIEYRDIDFAGSRTTIKIIFAIGYICCFVVAVAAVCGVYGKEQCAFFVGYAIGAALMLVVLQIVIDVVFEIVKNTREIRNELEIARRYRE